MFSILSNLTKVRKKKKRLQNEKKYRVEKTHSAKYFEGVKTKKVVPQSPDEIKLAEFSMEKNLNDKMKPKRLTVTIVDVTKNQKKISHRLRRSSIKEIENTHFNRPSIPSRIEYNYQVYKFQESRREKHKSMEDIVKLSMKKHVVDKVFKNKKVYVKKGIFSRRVLTNRKEMFKHIRRKSVDNVWVFKKMPKDIKFKCKTAKRIVEGEVGLMTL